jgi:hypothetical protein
MSVIIIGGYFGGSLVITEVRRHFHQFPARHSFLMSLLCMAIRSETAIPPFGFRLSDSDCSGETAS